MNEIDKWIAKSIGIDALNSGKHQVRNEKGWLDNELEISYIVKLKIKNHLDLNGGIFTCKIASSKFREKENKENLIIGVYAYSEDQSDFECFVVNDFKEKDILIKFNGLNFLNMKSGLVLGGYSYELNQYSGGSKLVCNFSNPRDVDWDNWETETLSLGMKIAEMSKNDKLKSFFS